ncbi:hypothetical protein KIPB_006771, partial [Kipferlia bialata]
KEIAKIFETKAPEQIIKDGLRWQPPYPETVFSFSKGRWLGRYDS